MSVENQRNSCQALQYLVSEAKNTLELLQRLHKEIRRRIDERDFNPSSDLKGYDLGLCVSALKSHLTLTVARMFDSNPKSISFKTVEWFINNKNAKDFISKIHGEKIIGEIIRERHSWMAHMGSSISGNVSVEEICNSDLAVLLNSLEDVWTVYFFWFQDNGNN